MGAIPSGPTKFQIMTPKQLIANLDAFNNLKIFLVGETFQQAVHGLHKLEAAAGNLGEKTEKYKLNYKLNSIEAVGLGPNLRGHRPDVVILCGGRQTLSQEKWDEFIQPMISVNIQSRLFGTSVRFLEEEPPKSLEERIETLEGLVKQLQNKI